MIYLKWIFSQVFDGFLPQKHSNYDGHPKSLPNTFDRKRPPLIPSKCDKKSMLDPKNLTNSLPPENQHNIPLKINIWKYLEDVISY